MKYKNNGFLLFEFLVSSLLTSILFLIIYQSYRTTNNSVQYIKNNADFQMQKILLQYHLELDTMHIYIPNFFYELYPKIKKYYKESSEKKNNTSENEDKEIKEKLIKDFQEASFFFPQLIQKEKEIKISWISTRKILSQSPLVRVNYILKETDRVYKNKKLYTLLRREDSLHKNYTIKKKGHAYTFITYLLEPKIYLIFPKIADKKESEAKNEKAKKSDFIIWQENPKFIAKTQTKQIDIEDILKEPIMPFSLLINGNMVAYNLSKELEVQLAISFPLVDYGLEQLLDIQEESEMKEKNVNPQSESNKISQSNQLKPDTQTNQNTINQIILP